MVLFPPLRIGRLQNPPAKEEPIRQTLKCGDYLQDQIIHMYIRVTKDSMYMVEPSKSQNRYCVEGDKARLYTTQIHDRKLHRAERCSVLDIYFRYGVLMAKILMLDKGYHRHVLFDELHDFSARNRPIEQAAPLAKRCKLSMNSASNQIFDYLSELISPNVIYNVKIVDYDHKIDIYSIDILQNDKSLVTHIAKHFDPQALAKSNHSFNFRNGAVHYFRIPADKSSSYFIMNELRRVRIVHWRDVDSLNIIPDDPSYMDCHKNFTLRVKEMHKQLVTKKNSIVELGCYCFFKQTDHPELGEWLRGIVISAPSFSDNVLIGEETIDGMTELKKQLRKNSRRRKDAPKSSNVLIYKIRSIDYGFECVKSSTNLQVVDKRGAFESLGSWSLRCRLNGVVPLSDACRDVMSSWLRPRIFSNLPESAIYVIFKDAIKKISYKSARSCMEPVPVTLFHGHVLEGYEFKTKSEKKMEYDCLNTHLIYKGVARGQDIVMKPEYDKYLVEICSKQ